MIDNTEKCRDLLVRVNLIYGEIDAVYDSLQQELPTLSAQGLLQKTAILESLIEEARMVDGNLAEELRKGTEIPSALQELLAIRKNRIEKLFQNNRDLATRSENSQALLRHELGTMRQNRNALQGYRPPGDNRTGLIRTTF